MRRKGTLPLLELSVMLLVFALAAALCLKAFLWADQTSRESAALDAAVLCAQNAAERLRAGMSGQERTFYDADWNPTEENWTYCLKVTAQDSKLSYLKKAQVTVTDGADRVLIALPVAWQEVAVDEG